MTDARRPYRSKLRDEQARATRRLIVDAGAELFVARGYASTTIDAIAEAAGVGRKTVFTSVGGKAAVLKLAFDWALAGDDEPVAIADRPEMQRDDAGRRSRRPPGRLDRDERRHRRPGGGAAPRAGGRRRRRPGRGGAAGNPRGTARPGSQRNRQPDGGLGGLRPGLDPEQAAAIADLLIDPLPYRRLVKQHGWTPEAYTRYLQRAAADALLP